MTKIHPQVMQGAGYFHDQIGEACFGVTKLVFDDATTLYHLQSPTRFALPPAHRVRESVSGSLTPIVAPGVDDESRY